MVRTQLVVRGIHHPQVLEAMRTVPREEFVPERLRQSAYEDEALPIGLGQTISQPYMVADMTEALDVQPAHKVLEIGTGSGYQTAVLCRLARTVCSVERLAELAQEALERLQRLGFHNVKLMVGDGSVGWAEQAPFDRILVTAGAPHVPGALLHQLSPGGRLVIPVGSGYEQVLNIVDKNAAGKISTHYSTPCRFVPLIGKEGFGDEGGRMRDEG